MKYFLLITGVALLSFAFMPEADSSSTSATAANPFKIKKGTNIAHWLSQSKKRGAEREAFFTEKDVAMIKSFGFDHFRLPVDEEQLWDAAGNKDAEGFRLLNNALEWASKHKLNVVLDLHIIRSHYFNAKDNTLWTDKAEQDKLIRLWKDFSNAVGKYPNSMLAYEFMNEPVADDPEQWNALLNRVADSIRSWEPKRTLVIGSNRWQSVNTFDKLRVPANDPNIILSYHFYEPFMLTHVRASWTNLKDFKGEVQYPGQIVVNGQTKEEMRRYNRDTLELMMAKAFQLADKLKLPLYCGEFGCIDGSPEASKLAWYKDMVAIFNKRDVAYANWNYKAGSFGVVDAQMQPRAAYIEVLTGKKPK